MAEPIPDATAATRVAIEFLTPYVAADSDDKRVEAARYIGQRLTGPDAPDPITVIRGQLYLNELLLLGLAQANGADDLRAWAGQWLASNSPRLPE